MSMEIRYDKEADALYIRLKRGRFAKNKQFDDTTIFDLDKKGNILGIEILDASKRITTRSMARLKTTLTL